MRRKIYAKGSGKRASFGVALVLGVLALGAAPARGADPQENFHRYCAQCHGFEGNGRGVNAEQLEIAPTDLTNPKKVSSLTDDQIARIIARGGARNELSPLMPPWGNTLTRKEIGDLVRHIRRLCKCRHQ